MDRRGFLGRLAGAVAAIVVAPTVVEALGVAPPAAPLGEPFVGLMDAVTTTSLDGLATCQYTTIASLSRAYQRSTTKLYEAYTRPVPEYSWLAEVRRDPFAAWERRVLG